MMSRRFGFLTPEGEGRGSGGCCGFGLGGGVGPSWVPDGTWVINALGKRR